MKPIRLRKAVDIALPILGTVIVLCAILFFIGLYVQLSIALIGIFLIEAGIWKLSHPLLPNERTYQKLRTEVDDFIKIIRRLNSTAVQVRSGGGAPAQAAFEEVQGEMRESMKRMTEYAGVPNPKVIDALPH